MLILSMQTLLVALTLAQSAIAFCYSARALTPGTSACVLAAAGTTQTTNDGSRNENETKGDDDWVTLAESVRKIVLEDGSGELPKPGSDVELEYTGTLRGETEWSTDEVVRCWLSNLQGLDSLAEIFIEQEIDGSKLMDSTYFTEEYCLGELGIENKIQAKKLVMAAKRISRQQEEFQPGTQFDSSVTRGKNYSFKMGEGRVIRAIDLAVSTMKVGERARVQCNSDFAYGPRDSEHRRETSWYHHSLVSPSISGS